VVNDQHGQILQVEIVTFETAHIKRGKVRRAGTKFRGPVRVGAFYQVIAGYKYNSPLAQLQVGCKSAEAPSARKRKENELPFLLRKSRWMVCSRQSKCPVVICRVRCSAYFSRTSSPRPDQLQFGVCKLEHTILNSIGI
jgi:hypothetical protein